MDQALLLIHNELRGTNLTMFWNSERCYHVGIMFMLTLLFALGLFEMIPRALLPEALHVFLQFYR